MPAEIYVAKPYENQWLDEMVAKIASLSCERTDGEIHFCSDIVLAASEVVGKACELDENTRQERYGGCLVIGKKGASWFPVPVFFGGAANRDSEYGVKSDKYIAYALAKAAILVLHPEMTSSGQNNSLLEDERLYMGNNPVPAGAITLPDGTILSFSGFSQECDEAITLAIAQNMGFIDNNGAKKISEEGTRNSYPIFLELTK